MKHLDRLQRPLKNLRISVTDRCNLRCSYCMPEDEYVWFPQERILSFEEIDRLVGIFSRLGVDKVRLTGGEPLLRKDLDILVGMLAAQPKLTDLALTTNGSRLAEQAQALRDAGLHRLTLSLDTLDPKRFRELTRRDRLPDVLAGLDAAVAAGFENIKIDTVLMRGVNDDEVFDLVEFAGQRGVELRFIEYMDVGGATRWSAERVVSRADLLLQLKSRYGNVVPVAEQTSAPADRYTLPDGRVIGIIASTTRPFCSTCDRSRVTADGRWFLCLYARDGHDLMSLIRGGASSDDIAALIARTWEGRSDQGAVDRLELENRGASADRDELRDDPHFEMHTRGG